MINRRVLVEKVLILAIPCLLFVILLVLVVRLILVKALLDVITPSNCSGIGLLVGERRLWLIHDYLIYKFINKNNDCNNNT